MTTSAALPATYDYDPTQEVLLRRQGAGWHLCRAAGLVLRQDLQHETRTWAALAPMGALGFLVTFVMSRAMEAAAPPSPQMTAGVLWGAVLLAGPIGLERLFSASDRGADMAFWLAAPLPRTALFLGKWLFSSLLLLGAALVAWLAVIALFDAPAVAPLGMAASLVLGCLGYAAVGVVTAAITAAMRRQQGLVAVVTLPLILPLYMVGASLGGALLDGAAWPDVRPWFLLLGLFDVVALAGGLLAADHLWRDGP